MKDALTLILSVSRDHNKKFNINATRYKTTMRQSGNFVENQDLSAALRVTLSQRNSSNNKDTEDKHNPIYWNLYRVYK